MATNKENVQFVMQFSGCDHRTAKAYLKAHKGNVSQATIAARDHVELVKLAKMSGPVTAQDLINRSKE